MNHVLDENEQWPNSHDFAIQLGIYHIAGYLSICLHSTIGGTFSGGKYVSPESMWYI